MNLSDFITKYTNKGVNYDGAYGDQCMDLMHQYLYDVLAIKDPIVLAASYAKDVYLQFPNLIDGAEYFTKVAYAKGKVPQSGDILFWGTVVGPGGHVAVFQSGTVNSLTSFDQNYPTGSKCHLQPHNYNGLLGWLRPKKQGGDVDMEDILKQTHWSAYGRAATPAWLKEKLNFINSGGSFGKLLDEILAGLKSDWTRK